MSLPGLYLWGFLTPPVDGADLRAALDASCLRGALPPVDLPIAWLARVDVKLTRGHRDRNHGRDHHQNR